MSAGNGDRITQVGDTIVPCHDRWSRGVLNPEQRDLSVVLKTERQCRDADALIRSGKYMRVFRAVDGKVAP